MEFFSQFYNLVFSKRSIKLKEGIAEAEIFTPEPFWAAILLFREAVLICFYLHGLLFWTRPVHRSIAYTLGLYFSLLLYGLASLLNCT